MNQSIYVENLSKRFDKVQAVSKVSFSVDKGELFGFLGPNGAGKTTTINMLTGLARPDTGLIRIAGIDCSKKNRQAQNLIGVVPDESNLYPELSGFDNLCFCAALYGITKQQRQTRARDLLKDFGLADAANRRFSTYSKGMKRKLTIAAGMIHKPEILFLDEPTTGIDVASARQLRQLIADLNRDGTTIFLTTHYIEEAERLCGRIAFIVSGRIVEINSVADLLEPMQANHLVEIAIENPEPGIVLQLEKTFSGPMFSYPKSGVIRVKSAKPVQAGAIVHFLEEQGYEVSEARKIRASLEDVFVKITGIEANALKNGNKKGKHS